MKLTSIRMKISLLGGLCLLITAALIVTYAVVAMRHNTSTVRQETIDVATKYALAQAKHITNCIKLEMEVALNTAHDLTHMLVAIKDDAFDIEIGRDEVNGILQSVLDKNPHFAGVYTGWEPDAFDQLDIAFAQTEGHDATGRFIPHWGRTEDGHLLLEPLVDYEDEGSGAYYRLPKTTNSEQIIEPYVYPVQGKPLLVTSLVTPILVHDQFYGIVGINMQLNMFQDLVDNVKDCYDGTAQILLISHNGTLAAVTGKPELAGKPLKEFGEEDVEEDLRDIQNGEEIVEIEDGSLEIFTPLQIGQTTTPWSVKIFVPLEKITALADTQMGKANQDMIKMIAISVLCLVVALGFFGVAARSITRPITHAVGAAERLSEGDLDIEIHVATHDEIGDLSRSLRNVVQSFREITSTSQAIARGDLSHQVTPRSAQDALGTALQDMTTYLNDMAATATVIAKGDLTHTVHVRSEEDTFGLVVQSMTDGLHSLIQQIRTSVEQLAAIKTGMALLTTDDLQLARDVKMSVNTMITTVKEIGASVDEVAERMEVLSSAVEETSASVAQMTPSIGHIASNTAALTQQTDTTRAFLNGTIQALEQVVDSTETSKQLSQETMQDALEGHTAMTQVTTSMDVLQTTMTTAMEAMTGFSQRSQDIDTILEVIREIADQTSLLALNASIIAAQTGEHGRGFAVVAEEMKSLATDVATSAKDIATIVQTVQHDTDRVVRTVHEGVRNVEQGTERTHQAQDALQKIITSAQRSSTVVTDISEALNELMTNSQNVTEALEQVKAMTAEIHTATNEQQTSTVQINQAIVQMNDLASQIRHATMYQSTGLQQVLETTNEVTAVIDQNVDSSQQMTQATQDLTAQAELLLHSVDRFTLKP